MSPEDLDRGAALLLRKMQRRAETANLLIAIGHFSLTLVSLLLLFILCSPAPLRYLQPLLGMELPLLFLGLLCGIGGWKRRRHVTTLVNLLEQDPAPPQASPCRIPPDWSPDL
jgi:hypothetical protein